MKMKNGFMVLTDKPLDKLIYEPVESEQYKSYMEYINRGVQKDVQEFLLDVLNKDFLYGSYAHAEVRTPEFEKGYSGPVGEDSRSTRDICKVRCSITIDNTVKLPTCVVLTVPKMDVSGLSYRNGKPVGILGYLTIDDGVTYASGQRMLTIVNDSTTYKIICGNKPYVKLFKNEVGLIYLVGMLAMDTASNPLEGTQRAIKWIKCIKDTDFIMGLVKSEKYAKLFEESYLDVELKKILNPVVIDKVLKENYFKGYFDDPERKMFSTEFNRDELNNILSLKHAVDRFLSEDVKDEEGNVLIPAGTFLTEDHIKILEDHHINIIYVKKFNYNYTGYYLTEPYWIYGILEGDPVIPEMIEKVPELKGCLEAPTSYVLEQPIIISDTIPLTDEHIMYLEHYKDNHVAIRENPRSKKIIPLNFDEEFISNRWFNGKYYNDNDEASEPTSLTFWDAMALLSYSLKLYKEGYESLVPHPDLGLRKKVKLIGDFYHEAFKYACNEVMYTVKDGTVNLKNTGSKLVKLLTGPANEITSDSLNDCFGMLYKPFHKYLQNIKVIESITSFNPTNLVSATTRINTPVKDKHSVADSMRYLTMGHYGKICPCETPQSGKLGVVNNQALNSKIENGILKAPYRRILRKTDGLYVSEAVDYLSVAEEEKYRIGELADLHLNSDNKILNTEDIVVARVPAYGEVERTTINNIGIEYLDYVNAFYNESISIAATTVPFIGSDDAARVTFGLSMVKQAKGLIYGEIPYVCTTGFLNIPNRNHFFQIVAKGYGKVLKANEFSMVVQYNDDDKPTEYFYDLLSVSSTSIVTRIPCVGEGSIVQKGDVLVTSNYVNNGVMCTGTNAIVAYMTDGYNYEDGVPCSVRLSKKLTSYGVHTQEDTNDTRRQLSAIPDLTSVNYKRYLKRHDVLYTKIIQNKNSNHKESRLIYVKKSRGFLAAVRPVVKNKNRSKGTVEGYLSTTISFDELTASDKICNRHGNKGVSCKIYNNSEMPYLKNGEFIDLKHNPNGVSSRMNEGQILEAKLGLACYILGIPVLCDPFNSPTPKDIKKLLNFIVDLTESNNFKDVFSKYDYPTEVYDKCLENESNIRDWKGVIDRDGKATLINPVSHKPYPKKVDIGVIYIYKLEQEGEGKLHSRAGLVTERYSKLESPPKGAKNNGGQKMGYMELDALACYGASDLLHEMVNERSDNYVARANALSNRLLKDDRLDTKDPGVRRSTELLCSYLRALGVESEFTKGELDPDKERLTPVSKHILKVQEQQFNEHKEIEEIEPALNKIEKAIEDALNFDFEEE